MKPKTKLFITTLILSISLQTLSAQSVDYTNKVEFSDNEINDDLNSINVLSKSKTVDVIKEVEEKPETTLTNLASILESKRLRYRNVRKTAEKCYRDTQESCAK